MRVLALDTTTRAGSIAIVDEGDMRFSSDGDGTRSHAERLPGDLQRALRAVALSTSDIDVFAVVAGPGSFTGLRVGIAAMQGLAVVHRRRMVAVPALLALGVAASDTLAPGTLVGAWMDAHRGEIFSALWRVTSAPRYAPGHLVQVDAAAVGDPGTTLARWTGAGHAPAVIIGDGAIAYGAIVHGVARVLAAPALAPTAGFIALARAHEGDTVDPAGVQPIYVRRPDAEVARDARLARAQAGGGAG